MELRVCEACEAHRRAERKFPLGRLLFLPQDVQVLSQSLHHHQRQTDLVDEGEPSTVDRCESRGTNKH